MVSPQAKAIENQFRLMRGISDSGFDLERERNNTREAHELTGKAAGVRYERGAVAGIPVVRAIPDEDRGLYGVVFLHGGAFCFMSAWTHHRLAGHIAASCRAQVVVPDFALAPERPFPAAVEECVAVVGAVRDGRPDGLVALMGDSSGGGLALSVLLEIRDASARLPFAAVLMAPWLDLTLSSSSVATAAESDVILTEQNLRATASIYLDGAAADDVRASPLYGDFHDLPPIYVQASGRDLLRDDSIRLRDNCAEQGVGLRFELFSDMLHSFQFFAGNMPEADIAVSRSAAFVEETCAARRCEATGAD